MDKTMRANKKHDILTKYDVKCMDYMHLNQDAVE